MNEIGFRQSYIHELASILGYVAAIFLFILSLDEYIYVHVARLEESTTSHICIYTCMITPVGGGRLIVYMYLQIQVALDGIELLSELINLGLLLFEGLETTGAPGADARQHAIDDGDIASDGNAISESRCTGSVEGSTNGGSSGNGSIGVGGQRLGNGKSFADGGRSGNGEASTERGCYIKMDRG